MTTITIQFDYKGSFRLVHEDGAKGDWQLYQHIATLHHKGKIYIAATQYGLLPKAEKVYLLTSDKEIKTATVQLQEVRPE